MALLRCLGEEGNTYFGSWFQKSEPIKGVMANPDFQFGRDLGSAKRGARGQVHEVIPKERLSEGKAF